MNVRDLISLSLLLVFYLACNRIFRERVSAQARYLAGIILMIVFLIPLRISIISMKMPEWIAQTDLYGKVIFISEKTEMSDFLYDGVTEMLTALSSEVPFFSVKTLWLAVYALGVFVSLAIALRKYFSFCKTLNRSAEEPSAELLWQMEMLCGKIGIGRQPRLVVCKPSISRIMGAPFTFGVFRKTVVIPSDIEGENAEILLEHELYHCKHRDSLIRLLMTVLKAFYWYYLPIYGLTGTLETVCEEACDERMTDGKNTAYRAAYGKLLIQFACERPAAAVSFSYSREKLKRRLKALFSDLSQREGNWLLLLVVSVAIALRGVEPLIQPNFNWQMSGKEYLQRLESQSAETAESDLLYAFEAAGALDDLAYGLYYKTPYAEDLSAENGIFYRNCLVSLIISESEDGTKRERHELYADENRARTCVGMRVIYGYGENGEKQYRSIEIMTEEELLRCYAAKMLSSNDMLSSEWEQKLIASVEANNPEALIFYRTLIERVQT